MQQLEVSIGIIEQDGTYLLQERVNDPAKGASGLIGGFGGKIEPNESPLEAVCRELSEETSLNPVAEDFKYIGMVDVISDRDNRPVQIVAHAFRLVITSDQRMEALEGQVVLATDKELRAKKNDLTPATRAVFEQLIGDL